MERPFSCFYNREYYIDLIDLTSDVDTTLSEDNPNFEAFVMYTSSKRYTAKYLCYCIV